MELPFDVVDLEPADHPEPGDTAPGFTRPLVTAEYWADRSLASLAAEGPLLLVFHPMDGAFPTTYVWNEVADRGWADRDDLAVVGLSTSTPYEHRRLIDDTGDDPPARLFSDPQNHVAERYGVAHDLDGMTGVAEPRPAVFLVDDDRTVTYAWVATEWPEFPPYDAIEDALPG
ncbi:MAG: redoxin domain-containing protein [Halobacteriaceae archaeon]